MSRTRHQRVKELFLAACELQAPEQRAYLARECGADRELEREVAEMLHVDASGVPPLEQRALAEEPQPAQAERIPAEELQRLGARASARCYMLAEELGRGGMGQVVRARDVDLRRDLAMKVSLGGLQRHGAVGLSASAGVEALRFLEEARTTARLDHPGIVPVHDLGLDAQGRLYFTMKLVEGRDLSAILALRDAQGWTTTRLVGVLQKVCEAVAFAHTKGVVHRDLKPANVRVGEYGEVYVMDWGISRALGVHLEARGAPDVRARGEPAAPPTGSPGLTGAGTILGTPYNMPPEQARGEPVGPAADVYAVGAMLYQVLCGRRPYERDGVDSGSRVLLQILQGPPIALRKLAPHAPAELVAITERAMARQAGERYADMRALAEDLRAYLEGRVVRAHRTGALAELRKWIARNRLAAAGLAATLLSVVGGLLWIWRVEARSSREIDLASDYFRARVVRDSADELWPSVPAMVPALEDWIVSAQRLLSRRGLHAARLRRLEAAGAPDPTEIGRERALVEYLDELDGAGTRPGLLARVRARLEFARTVEERSLSGPAVAEKWRAARAEILAGVSHSAYAGLDLVPQLGLVPLGADPRSGLHEFAHLESGTPPVRDEQGRFLLTPETGLVLVLMPAGSFHMGGGEREGEPNFDPAATAGERPVREVRLEPFFLSKYELTQAQWERAAGVNPSRWPPGHRGVVTGLNPVEQVSWLDARRLLDRLGLVLPTEARWEYACRAGTGSAFTCDAGDLSRFANVADQGYAAVFGRRPGDEPFDDGFAFHAPVGQLAPNAFGLHDVHGNVLEWVLDPYGSYAHARDPRDGRSLGPAGEGQQAWWSPDMRISRGGCYELPGAMARSGRRMAMHPTFLNHALGVRPAREISATPSH